MSRQSGRCAESMLVVTCILAISSNAHALDISWINGSGGNFSTVSNWSDIPFLPDRAPGPSDVAHFGLSSSPPFQRNYTVSFTTDPTNQAFLVEDDIVTFDLNGHVYLTTSANPITIGTPSNFSGSLTITDGNVGATANSTLSLGAGDAGFLTVSTGGLLAGTAMDINMGGAGGGTLTVNNGGDVVVDAVSIGNSANTDPLSAALITGAGSALAGSTVTVGKSGGGTLRISNGGAVESTSGVIADLTGSGGLAIIENAGSRWTISGDLSVGKSGNAGLIITSGGHINTQNAVIGVDAGSVGEVRVDGAGSTWTNSGLIFVSSFAPGTGTLTVVNGGTVDAQGGLSVRVLGTLRGDGQIIGDVGNVGVVAPGDSLGTLHVDGDYTQPSSGTTQIEIGGTTPGSQFDMLDITGAATLHGTLDVSLVDGFSPTVGNLFEVVHADGGIFGGFDTVSLPTIPNGMGWAIIYTSFNMFLNVQSAPLYGDYNQDGIVDAADYTVWRDELGSGTSLPNDDTAGVGIDDYTRWKMHFGETGGSGAGASVKATVPEPATPVLFIIGMLSFCSRRRATVS
jgi:T5SS/PEP-CTERM-associated repeat protein